MSLSNKKRILKHFSRPFWILFLLTVIILLSCQDNESRNPGNEPESGLLLGFSQIGAESAWRTRNTQSVKEAAEMEEIQLLFENAEQKQENQIKALRSFIVYQVDVIAFVPIVADGWDNILKEAHDAGIPVLVTDRKINTSDENLYAGFIGTDSEQEGRDGAMFLLRKFESSEEQQEPVRIVEISGTEGSSVAIGRASGFRDVLEKHPRFSIIRSVSGDFLPSRGYEIMRQILSEDLDLDVLYSHNDGMTLGAMRAMKEKGLRPGIDIVIVTIDAQQAAIDALKRGEVNCVIECNPNTGPLIMDLAEKLAKGESIPRLQHVSEEVFTEYDNLANLAPRGY